MSAPLLQAALAWARAGRPVFPCGSNKRPIVEHGFLAASTDRTIIETMFSNRGARLIGIPTGEASGVDALDLDLAKGPAPQAWHDDNRHRLPETRIHRTMSGGLHLLFQSDGRVRNSQSRIAPYTDVRGGGGYIIVPPSPGYSLICGAPIAPWPDWLLQPGLALPQPKDRPTVSAGTYAPASDARLEGYRVSILDGLCRRAVDGQKHSQLLNHALALGGIMEQCGFGEGEAVEWLLGCLPSTVKDWKRAAQTARWALAAGRDKPISLDDRPDRGRAPARPAEVPTASLPPPRMVSTILARTLARLANTSVDERQRSLGTAAYSIGGLPGISESEAIGVLLKVALGWKIDEETALGTITRGMSRGRMRPLTVGGRHAI